MFANLIASLTRKPAASLLAIPTERPTLALVPVSAAPVQGYSYGREELRRKAMQARTADRAWQ